MNEKLAVVYTAKNKQQAHMLKNRLEEAGIEAAVTGELLSDGTGVDAVGWATAARVMVAEHDALAARRLAEQFDRQDAQPAGPFDLPDKEQPDELTEWPTCPDCGARRTTTCPICHTSGTDFPEADSRFAVSAELSDDARPISSCGCDSGGCSTGEAPQPPSDEAEAALDEPPPGLVLTCTMCDEPFRPDFPLRCEWCGHEFPDGYPVDVEEEGEPPEQITTRALAVMIVLAVLGVGLAVYFLFLVPGK